MVHGLEDLREGEYSLAAKLFGMMTHLRKIWVGFTPIPPFKRSDLPILQTIEKLSHEGENLVTMGQIAKFTGQTPPAVSQKIRGLEAEGYLQRTGDENDRRVVYIELTEKGKDTSERAIKAFLARIESVLEEMGEGKAEQLFALLQEMCVAADKVQTQEGVKND